MITFKKRFDFYATDGELDVFANNIFDTDHRYVTVNILDKVLH
jgi:hypothetical protein